MLDDFLVRAALGGIGVVLAAAPLGCFMVWRRLAYFGSALSHSALLGVALGLLVGIGPTFGIAVLCLFVAVVFVLLEERHLMASDTLLGLIAHVVLAAGVIAISAMEQVRVDLMGYLFGDILSIGKDDLALIYGLAVAVLLVLVAIWRSLLSATVHEDLARVEGVATVRTRLLFMLLLALVVAIGMKAVGILMVVSLLIIPAASARPMARTPEAMAIIATLLGVVAVLGGLWGSWQWDLPSGPAIVVASAVVFAAMSIGGRLAGLQRR
jgi:zinc transport system permease protein